MQRQANQTLFQQASSVGMTVEQFKQMKEDKEYRDEIKAIEEEEQAGEQAAERPVFQEKQSWSNVGDPSDPAFDDPFFNRNKIETPLSQSGAHGDYTGEQEAAFEGMYPDRYKDSVKKDESFGVGRDESGVGSREREIYADTAFGKMKVRSMENQAKIRSGEMTPDEAEEDYNAYRQGLIREINIEKAGPEFQGVGVMPPQEQPPEEAPPEASGEDFEGFMPPEAAAGEQADIQRDENDPAVQEFKELNKKAVAGDKEAEEERAKIFEGMPKEEKAMAKEELGNYYIGPGGYAINLDKVDASLDREAQFKLLQMLPDHAKPYMLGEWGYIDKEDLKNMPESPEYHLEEMKLMKGLEKTRLEQEGLTKRKGMGVEGSKDVATIQTEAQKIMAKGKYANNVELQTMQDHASQTALKMNLDWQALKQSSVEMMAMNDRELRKHVADMQNVTANKEIDEHTNRLIKQISSNESIAKWGIEAKKALQTDAGVLQKELAEMGHKVTREEIQATKDRLTTQLASDKTLKKMGIDGSLLIAGDKNEVERYRIQTTTDVDLEKIHMLRDHFKQEMTFKGKELDANMAFKGASLAQMGATELMKHQRLSKQGQRDWLVKQHTMNQQAAQQMFDNGQVEAAMMIQARNGVSTPPNLVNFWRMRGKRLQGTAATQRAVANDYEGMTFDEVNEGYLKELNGMYKGLLKTKKNEDGYTALEQSVVTAGGKPWSEMSERERAEQVDSKGNPILSYGHWEAVKIQETIDRTFNNPNSMYGSFHHAMKSDEMKAQLDANKKKNRTKKGSKERLDEFEFSDEKDPEAEKIKSEYDVSQIINEEDQTKVDNAINKMSDVRRKKLVESVKKKQRPSRNFPLGQLLYDIVEGIKGDSRGTMLNYILRGGGPEELDEDQNPFATER